MKRYWAIILILLLLISCGNKSDNPDKAQKDIVNKNNSITEIDTNILGFWSHVSGGVAEYILFGTNNDSFFFTEYLHNRILREGDCYLKHRNIMIVYEDGGTNIYTNYTIQNNILTLYRQNGINEIYKRIRKSEP